MGLSREAMLLPKQETPARSDADAIAACRRHDAFDAQIQKLGVLDPVLLRKPRNEAFVPLHEQALQHGSAMSYDPNSAPDSAAPVARKWGFSPADGR